MSKQPNYVFDTDDELYHHGILGQRWGHRRFQNEDGSWTPEGRERYGEGGARSKSDVQKYKAKVSYNTQKYKADLKSKAQRDKDKRAAKEERNRLKEQAKTEKVQKKEQAKLDQQGAKKFGKTKNMSDEDLQKAIDRLKLQSEYNKQYTLAKNPDGALAKADRFFSGETGKFVSDLAVKTIPAIATAATKSIVDYNLKKTDSKEIEKKNLEIEKAKVEIENLRKQAPSQQNVNKTQTQTQPQSTTPTQQNIQKSKVQNDKSTKENIKSIVNDTKTISNNVKSTVDTGYRLYKLYTDRVSTKTVSSINTSASVVNSIPKSSLQLPVNNIAGYLPATSKVLDERRKK